MNKISIAEAFQRVVKLKSRGVHFTLMGIGPMSYNCIDATIRLAQKKDFPILFIASRNQVDGDEFGGGYVCGFDQKRFKRAVADIAARNGFDGLCYLCRDHGGPWQRDEERAARLPADRAMAIAVRSYVGDMQAGFDLLHIDPTKDPHIEGIVPLDLVLDRTEALIGAVEAERTKRGLPAIAYEVGTEETSGGLTSLTAFRDFTQKLTHRLNAKGLPRPLFIVGQTGTLTRLTQNVGNYNTEEAVKLTKIANEFGLGLKEHNGDYLSNNILLEHTAIGLDAMNIAPEFGVMETTAYVELEQVEEKFTEKAKRSRITDILTKHAIAGERWRKWMVGSDRTAPAAEVAADTQKARLILSMCGHYTLENPDVKAAIAVLTENITALGIDARDYVVRRIKDSIDRYAACFNNYGLTSNLLKA
ncbi:tagatose-6-phosphate kinase [Clostridia bacterium]|nr:tagatose-6-phosphate kinase [Clostridia bacterium]